MAIRLVLSDRVTFTSRFEFVLSLKFHLLGSPPGPELEYAVDRESYSLAAGLSLGMITLGCGNNLPGMTDLDMVDQLYHYINGGIKKVILLHVVYCHTKRPKTKYATICISGKIGRG